MKDGSYFKLVVEEEGIDSICDFEHLHDDQQADIELEEEYDGRTIY